MKIGMIENPEIASIFEEVADCLEAQQANPFRVRAYRNAASVIRALPEPAATLESDPERRLEELPGIGKGLADKIRTILRTGDLPLHAELSAQVPPGARRIMRVPGLGPRRAEVLGRSLGIRSVEAWRRSGHRFLYKEAKSYADSLARHLRQAPGVTRLEIARAIEGRLPRLVRLADVRGDLHMHTTATDGRATLEQMLAAADWVVASIHYGRPERLDLDDEGLMAAREKGIPIVIDSDAHSISDLDNMDYGVHQARRAGLTAEDVANTRAWPDFQRLFLRR